MRDSLKVDGRDIPRHALQVLNERSINLKSNAGFKKIVASIAAIGLIEPLAVYRDGKSGTFRILDGYLRYKALEQLGVERVPCLVYPDMQAYSFNKNVNRLSACQEMRMLQKSLEILDESTIAKTLGIQSIKYRLAPKLVQELHANVVRAFEDNRISKVCARQFRYVVLDRQAEILNEMAKIGDYTATLCRSLVLRTPARQQNNLTRQPKAWNQDGAGKKDLMDRLEKAEKQHDFYSVLYRQYSTDLLRVVFYVRQLITQPRITEYLKLQHADLLARLTEIVFESSGKA